MIKIWTSKYYLLSLLSLLGLFCLVFLTMSKEEIDGVFLNTDTLYQPSLYWDVIDHGNDMARWSLNPAPNFFPDMGIYMLLMLISGGSIIFSSFVFSIIQLLIINLLLFGIFKYLKQGIHHQIMFVTNFLIGLYALTDLISDNFPFCFNLLSNSYHMGSFVNTLLGIYLILSIHRNSRTWKYIVLGFICLLGFPSDKIFLISFVIPVGVSLMVKLFYYQEKRILLFSLATILISTFLGWQTLEFLILNKNLEIEDPHSFLNFENIGNSWDEFMFQMKVYWADQSFVTLILTLAFLSIILQVVLAIRELIQQRPSWYGLFSLVNLAVIFAPILAGNYTGFDTLRYNFHGYLFAICLLPLVFYELTNKPKLITEGGIISLGFQLTLIIYLYISLPLNSDTYFNYYPEIAQVTDTFVRQTGQNTGTAQYWQAKVITLFSKENAFVVPTFESLLPYDHATSKEHFSADPRDHSTPLYTFSIIDLPERKQAIIDLFGEQNVISYIIDDVEFLVHPAYFYQKDSYIINPK